MENNNYDIYKFEFTEILNFALHKGVIEQPEWDLKELIKKVLNDKYFNINEVYNSIIDEISNSEHEPWDKLDNLEYLFHIMKRYNDL